MRAVACSLALAATGSGVGFVVALHEVLRQSYPSQGFWRTSLWISSRGAAVGAAVGAAAPAAAFLLLYFWGALIARSGADKEARSQRLGFLQCPAWAMRLIVLLALLTAAAVLLVPRRVPFRFGTPYAELAMALLALLWVGVTMLGAGIASLTREEESREEWFKLRWITVLAFGWAIVFLRLWAWAASGPILAVGAAFCTAAVVGGYFGLMRPARAVHTRLGVPLGRAIAGGPGWTLAAMVALAALALWVGSWRVAEAARGEARQRGMNVIVICIDTLRADRPSFFAADERPRDLTPNIRDLLALRGAVYTNAITQAPWTMPAVASIMTGLYPTEHGAEQRSGTLAPNQLTLPEILREAGYRTMGASSIVLVSKASGVAQGFELFDESQALDHINISSRAITDKAIEFLRAHAQEPFFLYAHYFDPHWAYRDHREYDFADDYEGWLQGLMPDMRQNEFQHYVAFVRPRPRRQLFDPDEQAYLFDLYEEEIAHTDAEIGRLLRHVRQSGLEPSSLLIVVADHGEEFLERGNLGHGKTVHEELIKVPLLIAEPSSHDQSVVGRPVETRALFTTILDFLDVPTPEGRAFPASLLSDNPAESTLVRSATYTLVSAERGRRFAEPVNLWWTCVRDERWKLVKEHLRGRALLYDLENDPGETRECSAEHPEERKRLERHLDRLDAEVQRGAPSGPIPEADEEQQRRLRSLGYL